MVINVNVAEPSAPSVAAVVQFVGKLGEFNAPSADAFSPAEEEVARAFCAGVGALLEQVRPTYAPIRPEKDIPVKYVRLMPILSMQAHAGSAPRYEGLGATCSG